MGSFVKTMGLLIALLRDDGLHCIIKTIESSHAAFTNVVVRPDCLFFVFPRLYAFSSDHGTVNIKTESKIKRHSRATATRIYFICRIRVYIFIAPNWMGCAKSTQQQQPDKRAGQNKQQPNHQPLPKVSQPNNPPVRNQPLPPIHDEAAELNSSGRPNWHQPPSAANTLNLPQVQNISNSPPINIIFSSDHDTLPDLGNIANLQSKQNIEPHPHPLPKMSVIQETEQEQAVPSNEIQKLHTSHKSPKEQLQAINSHIRKNSEHLQAKVQEEEIKVEAPQQEDRVLEEPARWQQQEQIGEEQVLTHFSVQLPSIIEIRPQLVA